MAGVGGVEVTLPDGRSVVIPMSVCAWAMRAAAILAVLPADQRDAVATVLAVSENELRLRAREQAAQAAKSGSGTDG